MDEKRRIAITREVLKLSLIKDGNIQIVSAETWRRKMGQFAEKIGISLEEALEFSEILVREMVEEMLDQSNIGKKPLLGAAFKQ